MTVTDKKPVPIYSVECHECHSKIEFKKSEVHFGFIDCPVCGVALSVSCIHPARMEEQT